MTQSQMGRCISDAVIAHCRQMAAKKQSPAMAFIVAALKKDKSASYQDLAAAAEEKGLQLYPVMYGRAQKMLGLVKGAKRAPAKPVVAKAKAAAKSSGGGSKSDQVRELLGSGMTAAEIAKKVGCTVPLIYNVKSKANEKKSSGKGRPRKVAAGSGVGDLGAILAAVQEGARETDRMRKALEKIQGILQEV